MLTQEKITALTKDISAAIADIAKKHDIDDLIVKDVKYTDNTVRLSLKGVLDGGVGMNDWVEHAPKVGLDAAWFGKQFTWNNKSFTISGFETKNSLFPVLAKEKRTNLDYKFSVGYIRYRLGE